MILNIDKYMSYTDCIPSSTEQREEMIRVIWAFIESQVDQAFGLHPVQQACGKKQKTLTKHTQAPLDSRDDGILNA